MIRNVLESIEAAPVIAIVVLLTFVLVFAGAVVWTFRLDREHIQRMRRLPLDSSADEHVRDTADG